MLAEDIIEEIISEEIVDETDQFRDNHSKLKARRSTTSTIMRGYAEFSCICACPSLTNAAVRIVERRKDPVMGLFNESSQVLTNSRTVSLELQNGYSDRTRYSDPSFSRSESQSSL